MFAGICLRIWGNNTTWSALSNGDAQLHASGAHETKKQAFLEEMQLHHRENCLLLI